MTNLVSAAPAQASASNGAILKAESAAWMRQATRASTRLAAFLVTLIPHFNEGWSAGADPASSPPKGAPAAQKAAPVAASSSDSTWSRRAARAPRRHAGQVAAGSFLAARSNCALALASQASSSNGSCLKPRLAALAWHLTIGPLSPASFLIAVSSHLSAGGSVVVLVVVVVVGVRVEVVVLAPAGSTITVPVMPKETCTVQMYGNVPGIMNCRENENGVD